MSWVSFIAGAFSVLFFFALFNNGEKEEMEVEQEMAIGNNFTANNSTERHVILSCQTCRKLKRHQEIEPNLYECSKCKRLIDLR